jgi:anti-sigma regulatory factor (Ser/Thr protein kinase)
VSTLDAPKAARRFVVGTLARWDQYQLADQAALVVSELATNAVIHARSDFIVSMSSLRQAVRISVRDTSVAPPTQRDSAPMALSGRGLGLVAALASRWGVDLLADGKVVWAELVG